MQRKEGEVKKKSLLLHIIFSRKKELGGLQLICLALTDQFCTLNWKNCAVPAIAKTAAVVSISRIAVIFQSSLGKKQKINYQVNTTSDIKILLYGTPIFGKTTQNINLVEQTLQTSSTFVVATNRNASCVLSVGQSKN